MEFQFDLLKCAYNNSNSAVIRESTRLACIAWCLQELGHQVHVPEGRIPETVKDSWRYEKDPFRSLNKTNNTNGIRVTSEYDHGQVLIKTSVSCSRDEELLDKCQVLVAHEYDPRFSYRHNLLPIPFLVHDRIIEYFQRSEAIRPYLLNDLNMFRACMRGPVVPKTIGFIGYNGYGRREALDTIRPLLEQRGFACDFLLYDGAAPLSPGLYLCRTGGFTAGILLEGDTPKTNRQAEYAMLGIPMISTPRSVSDSPDVAMSHIVLASWDDEFALDTALNQLEASVNATDNCYLTGWSPMGQAKLIVEHLQDDH